MNGGGGAPYSPAMQGSDAPQPRSESRAESSALVARRERRSPTNPPLTASQKVNRQPPEARRYCDHNMTPPWPKPKQKIRRKRGRKKVSDRLIAPTITSMAKSGALERDAPRTPRLNRPLSEPAVRLPNPESSPVSSSPTRMTLFFVSESCVHAALH